MGALDDAIREHLELKRQHGASEQEIQQAEAEALGPARRGSVPTSAPAEELAAAEPLEAPPVAGTEAVSDAPPPPPLPGAEPQPFPVEAAPFEPPVAHVLPAEPPPVEPAPVEPAPVEPPPVVAPADEPTEAPPPGTPKPHGDPALGGDDPDRTRTAILDDPLAEPPPPIHHEPGPDEPPAPALPPHGDALDETRVRSVVPEPSEPEPAPADEDVLEETPDFLQETPEHDRLWFEQKPPRDFDFDD